MAGDKRVRGARTRREDLILRAIEVVEDAIKRCQYHGVLDGTKEPGLGLALAFLYAIGRDRDYIPIHPRAVFDEIWNAVTGVTEFDERNGMRATWARTHLACIERRVDLRAIVADPAIRPFPDPCLLRRYEELMRQLQSGRES